MAYKVFFSAIPENRQSTAIMASNFFLRAVQFETAAALAICSENEQRGADWCAAARRVEGGRPCA
jgi:hypothetical protein